MQITINGLSYRVRIPFDVHFIQTNQDQKSTVGIRGYVEELTLTGYYFTYVCNNNMTTINHSSPNSSALGPTMNYTLVICIYARIWWGTPLVI